MTVTRSLILTSIVLLLIKLGGLVELTTTQMLFPLLVAAIFNLINYTHFYFKMRGFKKALEAGDMETILNDDQYKDWLRQVVEHNVVNGFKNIKINEEEKGE